MPVREFRLLKEVWNPLSLVRRRRKSRNQSKVTLNLARGSTYDQKFVITTNTQSGLAFTSTGVKRGEGFSGDVNTSFVNKNITADVKVDTKSNVRFISVLIWKDFATDDQHFYVNKTSESASNSRIKFSELGRNEA